MRQGRNKTLTQNHYSSGVTIITPSYNYARFIRECALSVRSESKTVTISHIIQDGLSEDDTLAQVSSLNSHSVILISEQDAGQSDALNKALSLVGDDQLVGWLNADEYYLPGAIDYFYQAAAENPDVEVFYGDCLFVDKRGNLLRALPSHRMSKFVLRHYGCFIPSCTLFVRASALKKFGWDVSFRRTMDWDLYLAMLENHQFKYVPYTAAAFRVHEDQVTNTPEKLDELEFMRLRAKHSINKSSFKTLLALMLHAVLKVLDGGYIKQLRYRKIRGQKIAA
jgi:glycosyltransferase involved in cell wall biosynthesis